MILQKTVIETPVTRDGKLLYTDRDEYILWGCDVCGDPINPRPVKFQGKEFMVSYPHDWRVGHFNQVAHEACGKIWNKATLPTIGEFLARADKHGGPHTIGQFSWRVPPPSWNEENNLVIEATPK